VNALSIDFIKNVFHLFSEEEQCLMGWKIEEVEESMTELSFLGEICVSEWSIYFSLTCFSLLFMMIRSAPLSLQYLLLSVQLFFSDDI